MAFLIVFHSILVLIGFIGVYLVHKYRDTHMTRLKRALMESMSDCLGLGVITFILVNIGEFFNQGLRELINTYWYLYIVVVFLVFIYLVYHFYTLPFIKHVIDIIDDKVVLKPSELKLAKIDIQQYQTLAGQRLSILACMAPLGILLPFMSEIFVISHVSEVGIPSLLSISALFVYCLLLWHTYTMFKRATKLISTIDKQDEGLMN